jgi:predicted kinase
VTEHQTPGGGDSTGSATGADEPRLIVVLGPAGSGKSQISRRLAASLGAVYLDKDRLAGPLSEALLAHAGAGEGARDENDFYLESVMDREYESVLAVAADNLEQGKHVVIDAPFARFVADPSFIEDLIAVGRLPANISVRVVEVEVDAAVRRRRLADRRLERDAWKLAHWDAASSTTRCAWRGVEHLRVHNNAEGDASLSLLVEQIARVTVASVN